MLEANLGNWNISVPRGKEINRDFLSSGERKGKSPVIESFMVEKNGVEKPAEEGDSPVFEKRLNGGDEE